MAVVEVDTDAVDLTVDDVTTTVAGCAMASTPPARHCRGSNGRDSELGPHRRGAGRSGCRVTDEGGAAGRVRHRRARRITPARRRLRAASPRSIRWSRLATPVPAGRHDGPGGPPPTCCHRNLAGLGIATGAGVEVGRWTDTTDILTQATIEIGSGPSWTTGSARSTAARPGSTAPTSCSPPAPVGWCSSGCSCPAYTRLAKPPLPPAKLADYLDLYQAENGLEFAAFIDDAQFLQICRAQLRDTVADVTAAQRHAAELGRRGRSGRPAPPDARSPTGSSSWPTTWPTATRRPR